VAVVRFTKNLSRFFPTIKDVEIQAQNVATLVQEVEKIHPGIRHYLVDDTGALRKHVNIFVDKAMIRDRDRLSDSISAKSDVFIAQALSGG